MSTMRRFSTTTGSSRSITPIAPEGPAAYFATLPVKAIVGAMRERGLQAGVSQTAGTFVCNHVFYGLLHHLQGRNTIGGFIHVPYLPSRQGTPSMALGEIIEGLKVAVEVAVRGGSEQVAVEGATH
jgi:pyroglutamyl-peptidase